MSTCKKTTTLSPLIKKRILEKIIPLKHEQIILFESYFYGTPYENSDVDICSSWVSEFQDDEKIISSYRKLPELNEDISKYGKVRCPINHPAVMYKKLIVTKAGGYKKMMWFEDYYLWARMIVIGAKFYNIQEALVNMRAGYGQLERRSGLKYAISEYNLQKEFLKLKFINIFEFLRNVSIRFFTRVIPKKFVKLIYKLLRS